MASEPKKKKSQPGSPAPGALSKYEKWTPLKLRRNLVRNAPYNPRTLSEDAKKKLRKNIEGVGLVQPIIWNATTGNCLGGHQRLAILDALEGRDDYELTVARVELDEKTEKEQNIFLNNTAAQGDWDLEKLAKMLKEDDVNFEQAGFDMAELYQLFGDSPFQQQPEELAAIGERVRAARANYLGLVNRKVATDDVDFYLVLVFEGNEQRAELSKELGLTDNKFFDGKKILELIRENRKLRGIEGDTKKPETPAQERPVKKKSVAKDKPEGAAKPG
jgi:ParB-like chromosome segregation protein Spo0J